MGCDRMKNVVTDCDVTDELIKVTKKISCFFSLLEVQLMKILHIPHLHN